MQRTAKVVWDGELRSGKGTIDTGSKAITGLPVTFPARLEDVSDVTSPEELIAAAHATCFAMSLSNVLTTGGNPPERLEISATCALERTDSGLKIASMKLDVKGKVAGVDGAAFEAAAKKAEQSCPVSNALRGNVEISVNASLG